MIQEKTLLEFTEELASKEQLPGVTGCSLLVASLGVSLGNMAAELSGNDENADIIKKLSYIREELLYLLDSDAETIDSLEKALAIPEEDSSRTNVLENALRIACTPSMDIMRSCAKAIVFMGDIIKKCPHDALIQVGGSVLILKSALQTASLSVFLYTKSMVDRNYAEALEKEVNDLLEKNVKLADRTYRKVIKDINK